MTRQGAIILLAGLALGAHGGAGTATPTLRTQAASALNPEADSAALAGKLTALAAEQHGKIVYRRRFDERPDNAPVDIRSAGKSLTALAVGAAIADGKLSGTDVRVWPYLGASRGEPFDSITLRDLLAMSSVLDCFDADRKSPGQEERMYRTRDWRAFALALPARKAARDAQGFYPWSYCTAGSSLPVKS